MRLAAILLLLLTGCRWPGVDQHGTNEVQLVPQMQQRATKATNENVVNLIPVPQMPSNHVLHVAGVSIVPRRHVVVLWDNPEDAWQGSYVSVLQSSTNQSDWFEVARFPYAAHIEVTLDGTNVSDWFRPYNALSPEVLAGNPPSGKSPPLKSLKVEL